MRYEVVQYKLTNTGVKKVKPKVKKAWVAIDPGVHQQLKDFCKHQKITMKTATEVAVLDFINNRPIDTEATDVSTTRSTAD